MTLCKEKNLDCSEMWCNSIIALYSGLWGRRGRMSRSRFLVYSKLNCFTVVSVLMLAHLSKEIGFIHLIQSNLNPVEILSLNLVFRNNFYSVSLKIISVISKGFRYGFLEAGVIFFCSVLFQHRRDLVLNSCIILS